MIKSLAAAALAMLLQTLAAPALAGTHTAVDAMFKSAESADISEDFDDAALKYQDLITTFKQSDPENILLVRAQARLARIYILKKQFDKAEPFCYFLTHSYRSTLELDPELMIDVDDLSEAYMRLATDPHFDFESLKRCLALRLRINSKHPRLPEVYRALSEKCASCTNTKDAVGWILKGIEIEKHNSLSKQGVLITDETYLASLYLASNNLDGAKRTAEDGLDRLTKTGGGRLLAVQLHASLGRVYTKQGLFDQAEEQYQLALKNIETTDKVEQDMRTCITRFRQQNQQLQKTSKSRHQ